MAGAIQARPPLDFSAGTVHPAGKKHPASKDNPLPQIHVFTFAPYMLKEQWVLIIVAYF
jgi:hypothetical protein